MRDFLFDLQLAYASVHMAHLPYCPQLASTLLLDA